MASEMSVTPYVQVAAFCETVLQEASGNISLIRIIDRRLVVGPTEEMQPTTVNVTLVIILKSGNMQGSATMTIRPTDPRENPLPPLKVPVLFEGLERGVGLVAPMGLLARETGLYWFEVLIDDVALTRIPLRILYQQGQIAAGSPPAT